MNWQNYIYPTTKLNYFLNFYRFVATDESCRRNAPLLAYKIQCLMRVYKDNYSDWHGECVIASLETINSKEYLIISYQIESPIIFPHAAVPFAYRISNSKDQWQHSICISWIVPGFNTEKYRTNLYYQPRDHWMNFESISSHAHPVWLVPAFWLTSAYINDSWEIVVNFLQLIYIWGGGNEMLR